MKWIERCLKCGKLCDYSTLDKKQVCAKCRQKEMKWRRKGNVRKKERR